MLLLQLALGCWLLQVILECFETVAQKATGKRYNCTEVGFEAAGFADT